MSAPGNTACKSALPGPSPGLTYPARVRGTSPARTAAGLGGGVGSQAAASSEAPPAASAKAAAAARTCGSEPQGLR